MCNTNSPPGVSVNAYRLRNKTRYLARFDGKCFYCDNELTVVTMTKDHFMPKSWGNSLRGNTVIACEKCNINKSDQPPCRDLVDRFVTRWLMDTMNPPTFIADMFQDFIQTKFYLEVLRSWCGEPNIPGVIRSC